MFRPIVIKTLILAAVLGLQKDNLVADRPPTIGELLRKHNIELTQSSLIAALKHPDAEVRSLAAQKLTDDKTREAIPEIIEALSVEKVPLTRTNIAFSAAQFGEVLGFQVLERDCGDAGQMARIRVLSANYLLDLKHETVVCLNALLEILNNEDEGYAMQAASLLPQFKQLSVNDKKRVLESLEERLTSPIPALRLVTADALASLGDKRAIRQLRDAIGREQDDTVRSSLIQCEQRLERQSRR